MPDVYYLIEIPAYRTWWKGGDMFASFTPSSDEAIRFCRRGDAETVLRTVGSLLELGCVVTEHMDVPPPGSE